jgi:hypothetical protein
MTLINLDSEKKKIFFISFLIVFLKYLIIYISSTKTNFFNIVFNNFEDLYYLPYIKYLAELNFYPSFNEHINNLNPITIPYASLIYHAIALKIFGINSFIFLEFIFLAIFLYLFCNIIKYFYTGNSLSIAIFILSIPLILEILNLNINYINFFKNDFFDLRFPRPLITNIYFLTFVFLILKEKENIFIKNKNILLLSLILSLSFISFYYHFFIEIVTLLILFLIHLKKIKKGYLKKYLYGILLFLIICLPFIINIKFTENNFSERVGAIQVSWLDKEKIISYFFQKLSKINIILMSIFILIFLFYIKKYVKRNYNIKIISTLTIASIVAPVLFILFSGKISLLYHWTNSVLVCFFILCLALVLNYISEKKVTLIKVNIFYLIFFIYLIIFSEIIYKKNLNKKNLDHTYNEIFNQINKINNSWQLQTLVFDQKMTTWLIANNFTKLNLVSGIYTNYKNTDIDLNLIQTFKFLNLNSNDLVNFLKNEKKNWRYINKYVQNFYLYKYTANYLKTANNEFDFDDNVMNEFVQNTSPLHSQQLAIPIKDFKKLEKTFNETNLDRYNYPELIILDKDNNILKKNNLDANYCTIISNELFELKIIKKYKNYCL